ncbi:alpha/beta hydrolase [Agromyces sp. SYSU K20354]|uniref:alpha/beta fold hydrolase n=1 Tax=Agromyces cavernae TaxID=2898659 RepID=UPI001E5AE916|nr:alpha/beta fold hydrolase [Agromyces cavernae]MCD2443206.1 alpha/beta hydrolase [Agromyces cavernae]
MTGTDARPVFPELHPASATSRGTVVLLHGGNVANWMWAPQLPALTDFDVLALDLPAFGARVGEPWPGLPGAADDVVARIRSYGIDRPVHLVGLSLGGIVALRALERHPDAFTSGLASGAAVLRVGGTARSTAWLQDRFWDSPAFWRAQARAFRLPRDSRELYVEHGLSIDRESARRMLGEVYAGGVPDLSGFPGDLLAVAGSREPAVIRRSLGAIAGAGPHVTTRLAPGMHHVWNIEDVDLFNDMLRIWVLERRVTARLVEPR